VLRDYARQVRRKLLKSDADVIFSPISLPIAYLDCDRPMVFWRDATFAGLKDFYPDWSNLSKRTIRAGHEQEQAVLDKCRLAIFSSDWAVQTAIENYKVPESKLKVVPFGANIECDRTLEDIKRIVASRPRDRCILLFLGRYWYRKGADVAVAVAGQLNRSGLKTRLRIVGCEPPQGEQLPDFVELVRFISKSARQGKERIGRLLAESHFLILPSRADCTPIVLPEANSFGVPCLTTRIGGIPSVIKPDVNGKLFAVDADVGEYRDYVCRLFSNFAEYEQLALSSFHEYETRLNWSVSARKVKQLLTDILS